MEIETNTLNKVLDYLKEQEYGCYVFRCTNLMHIGINFEYGELIYDYTKDMFVKVEYYDCVKGITSINEGLFAFESVVFFIHEMQMNNLHSFELRKQQNSIIDKVKEEKSLNENKL